MTLYLKKEIEALRTALAKAEETLNTWRRTLNEG